MSTPNKKPPADLCGEQLLEVEVLSVLGEKVE